ncbi:RHS repeat domain-containing protein [Sodaliphilus pleomorphus]|uniref:RHS repeat domain-containing protein n=1 Tax=Sodaliphilus pleomorphus TaxID=2606626 RepID=UPI00240A4952|nr:RHS repeat domain-containing protein [Sodaliphilus pleomorphus]MDD6688368.1 RHS repeat protein [Sodaliphilus pleomorphus]
MSKSRIIRTIMQRIALLLIAIASALSAASRESSSLDRGIIPPTPTSAVFRKYMFSQPSLLTGAARFDIPVYTISCFGLSVPFTLSYMSNGIQVEDDPYPCGYGWALRPGLRITRTIMGRPDGTGRSFRTSPHDGEDAFSFYRSCVGESINLETKFDSEPDIFTLHLPEDDCTFVCDRSSAGIPTVVHNGTQDFKIETDYNVREFAVTDGRGVKYLFNADNTEKYSDLDVATAWMLSEIVLPNGKRVKFKWGDFNRIDNVITIPSYNIFKDSYINAPTAVDDTGVDYSQGYEYIDQLQNGDTYTKNNYSHFKHILSAEFPGGRMVFEYDWHKGSLSPEPYLKRIVIANNEGDTIKIVTFSYLKVQGQGRLLSEAALSDEGAYRFEYDPGRFEQQYGQDYWGYYNGKANHTLVPKMKLNSVDRFGVHDLAESLADRSVDTTRMKANILTKVIYPTGGFSAVEYEPHHLASYMGQDHMTVTADYRGSLEYGAGLRVKRVVNTPADDGSPVVKIYEYGDNDDRANCVEFPNLETFVMGCYASEKNIYSIYGFEYRYLRLSPSSDFLDFHFNEPPVWYSKVSEITAEGKTEYCFMSLVPGNVVRRDGVYDKWCDAFNTLFSRGPVNYRRTCYKLVGESYSPVSIEEEEYKLARGNFLHGTKISRRHVVFSGRYAPDIEFSNVEPGAVCCEPSEIHHNNYYNVTFNEESVYAVHPYTINFFTEQKTGERRVEILGSDSVVSRQKYSYIGNTQRISASQCQLSDGSEIFTRYYYPDCPKPGTSLEQAAVLDGMAARNIISEPCAVVQTAAGLTTESGQVYHKEWGMFLPSCEYETREGDTVVTYRYDHDSLGNLRSITYNDDSREAYLWGYGGMYPVFYVQGMNYHELVDLVGESSLPPLSVSDSDIGRYQSRIGAELAGKALLSGYRYKPLVGITATTDPSGVVTKYHYDGHNRLVQVDQDNHGIVETYNYRINNDTCQ